jgi:hypothetical protein
VVDESHDVIIEYYGELREAALSDQGVFDAMVSRYPDWVSRQQSLILGGGTCGETHPDTVRLRAFARPCMPDPRGPTPRDVRRHPWHPAVGKVGAAATRPTAIA